MWRKAIGLQQICAVNWMITHTHKQRRNVCRWLPQRTVLLWDYSYWSQDSICHYFLYDSQLTCQCLLSLNIKTVGTQLYSNKKFNYVCLRWCSLFSLFFCCFDTLRWCVASVHPAAPAELQTSLPKVLMNPDTLGTTFSICVCLCMYVYSSLFYALLMYIHFHLK